ncbi:helix-turn-helix domain-containing protein, partial [Vineibacter terrae]|uniref:helix-turn-helix domain-containing protein n=1 Tax=Vineibacter terrae TaxID=2586908 RepID=UPI002E302A6B
AVEMGVRPSVSIRETANLLGYDQSTVRRLLDSGELQGFRGGCRIRAGKRTKRPTLRVYLDSIAAHQRAGDLSTIPITKKRPRVGDTTPGHRAALAVLAAAGVFTRRASAR